MTRLRAALEALSDRGRPRGADAILRAAEDQVSARPAEGGPAAPGRSRLLVAAAVAFVLAAGGVGTFLLAGDDSRIDVTTTPSTSEANDPTTPTSEADAPTTPPSLEPTEPDPATTMPSTWVGHDDEHRLVVVDTASGEVVRVLVEFDDPDGFTERTGEPFVGGSFLGSLTVSPDGETVFYERCCEPAPGAIFQVPVAGGEPEQVTLGAHPAVSPDGSRLAVVEMQWIKIVDLATGGEVRLEATDMPMGLQNPAWSPDGRTLVFEVADNDIYTWSLVSLDVDRASSLDEAQTLAEADGDGSPGLTTFDAEGRVHAVRQHQLVQGIDGPTGPEGPARALVFDLAGPTLVSERELESAVRSQDHDATGSFLIRSFVDGTVRTRTTDGAPVDLATGYLAAEW